MRSTCFAATSAVVFACWLAFAAGAARSQTDELNQERVRSFVVHGVRETCSDVTRLDSVLAANGTQFFAGWTERDYADALAWAEGCRESGWHIPGRPRIALLNAQRERALGPRPPPAAPVSVSATAMSTPGVRADKDPLLTDTYYNAHFHEEAIAVAKRAGLDIGEDPGAANWSSRGTPAQLRNRLTADKIVMYCAHKAADGEAGIRPLLWDWRRCAADESAAYKRIVADNEYPAAGRGVVLGCTGLDSYLHLERCIANYAAVTGAR